jgi:hypothetical protein
MLHLHLVQVLVYALHEGVEMDPRLSLNVWRKCVVEQIHHHCLPTAYISKHIHALW